MNKEAVIVMLDCNSSMGKLFASSKGGNEDAEMRQPGDPIPEPETRFKLAMDSVKMLLEQKVSFLRVNFNY